MAQAELAGILDEGGTDMHPGTIINALTALTLAATPAMAQETAVDAILQADRDFAAMAAETGPGPAFEAYMDDVDGRLIRGTADALVGSAEIRGSFDAWPEGILLHWEPLEGFASEGGDFGVTWGGCGRCIRMAIAPARGRTRHLCHRMAAGRGGGNWRGLLDMGGRMIRPIGPKHRKPIRKAPPRG